MDTDTTLSIILTTDEKDKLSDLALSAPDLLKHRALLILAYSTGKPTLQASRESGISTGRARFWKRQFLTKRMAIFDQATEAGVATEAGRVALKGKSREVDKVDKPEDSIPSQDVTIPELTYPQPRKQIGILVDDTLADAGRKVWSYYFAEMLSHEAGTLLGEDIEELHDMRVATRRMRSAFDIFGQAFDQKVMKRHLKGLRIAGRVLGQVRDMDVILGNAQAYQKQLKSKLGPGMEPLLDEWMRTIEKQRSKLIKHLQSEEYQVFKYNFNLFLQPPEVVNAHVSSTDVKSIYLRDMVPVLVYSRYAAVRAYESLIPNASILQLHALRIECKKFRYTLEYFREILGDEIGQTINELKLMQDHLGELHDTDVACLLVRKFLKMWDVQQLQLPILERMNPEPVVTYLAYLHGERFRLMSSFPEAWKQFNRPEFRQRIAQAVSLL